MDRLEPGTAIICNCSIRDPHPVMRTEDGTYWERDNAGDWSVIKEGNVGGWLANVENPTEGDFDALWAEVVAAQLVKGT